jgi:DNA-directed RNA polymerase I subunit RPA1
MNMMGKRVNYAARSVISPDPYISTDQIGVPVRFAKRLTYPESFADFNSERLRQAVINGPLVHPGAHIVENTETGEKIFLQSLNLKKRKAIANLLKTGQKVVYRHLMNGDMLLVNRQPTLHKPSIMAHSARVLQKEQTIRMHYANCSSYNADFDGDEMNIHFCQNPIAIAEAKSIAATNK